MKRAPRRPPPRRPGRPGRRRGRSRTARPGPAWAPGPRCRPPGRRRRRPGPRPRRRRWSCSRWARRRRSGAARRAWRHGRCRSPSRPGPWPPGRPGGPTPPAAAVISTRWPGWTLAVSTRICQAVSPASGRPRGLLEGQVRRLAGELAGRGGDVLGVGRRPPGGTTACRTPRRPGASVVTPRPTSSTTPATSQPSVNGGSPSTRGHALARPGLPVDRVDPGRPHPDQHLGGQRLGTGAVRRAPAPRARRTGHGHRTHGSSMPPGSVAATVGADGGTGPMARENGAVTDIRRPPRLTERRGRPGAAAGRGARRGRREPGDDRGLRARRRSRRRPARWACPPPRCARRWPSCGSVPCPDARADGGRAGAAASSRTVSPAAAGGDLAAGGPRRRRPLHAHPDVRAAAPRRRPLHLPRPQRPGGQPAPRPRLRRRHQARRPAHGRRWWPPRPTSARWSGSRPS